MREPMGLIDSHAHLTSPGLIDQLEDVLARSRHAGVDQILTVATDLADASKAIDIAKRHPSVVRVIAGFHPHEADGVEPGHIAEMADLWQQDCVVAAGEMGLDYHYDLADRSKQRQVFAGQLQRAVSVEKPVVIHCRDAIDDGIQILTESGWEGRKVVFHCFTGTAEEAARIAEHGWRISFTGVVTYKKSETLQRIAKTYPADQLMVETDAPYLSPEPVRKQRPNEPAHVAHVARFLATLRNVPFAEFVDSTARNTRAFFGLGVE